MRFLFAGLFFTLAPPLCPAAPEPPAPAVLSGDDLAKASQLHAVYKLIDAALASRYSIPAFKTVSARPFGRGVATTTTLVRNFPDGPHFFRHEEVLELPKVPPQRTVFIKNRDGVSQLLEQGIIGIQFQITLEKSIPRRLPTAFLIATQNKLPLNESQHLDVSINSDDGISVFGVPCHRITISVAQHLRSYPILQPTSHQSVSSASGREQAKSVSSSMPYTFVYFINKETPFVMRWLAYDVKGDLQRSVEYAEFQEIDVTTLDASLFEVPSGSKRIIARNKEEHVQARKILVRTSAPTPSSTKD